MNLRVAIATPLLTVFAACSAGPTPSPIDFGADQDAADAGTDVLPDAAPDGDVADAAAPPPEPELIVVTFNTGTGTGSRHDRPPDDGYTSAEAEITDEWYGNGLNWPPLIEDVRAWFDEVRPDVVVFQEIFWTGECESIPQDAREGFVCEGWMAGDPTVARQVLGPDYQIACHPGKPDKCSAVHRDLGRFRGCEEDFCLEGMTGFQVDGCGSGARVARVVIDPTEGDPITLVNFHGSSGFGDEEIACRVQQVDQVFVDLGDGEPAANGALNLVMGDLNTDPGRVAEFDDSAARWNDFVGDGLDFGWLTDVGPDGPQTYGTVAIDHVASDGFIGDCWHAGATDGRTAVSEIVYFDHKPVVCELRR